jgi:hypothetical protein
MWKNKFNMNLIVRKCSCKDEIWMKPAKGRVKVRALIVVSKIQVLSHTIRIYSEDDKSSAILHCVLSKKTCHLHTLLHENLKPQSQCSISHLKSVTLQPPQNSDFKCCVSYLI